MHELELEHSLEHWDVKAAQLICKRFCVITNPHN